MKIVHNNDHSFPFVIIDDYYNNDELDLIWDELHHMTYPHKWNTPKTHPHSGAMEDGVSLKLNKFSFLDEYYTDRKYSNILNTNRKIFYYNNFKKIFTENENWFFNTFNTLKDLTLLSYYDQDGEYYKAHRDESYITCLSWFYKEPKKFAGGDMVLHNGEEKINIDCLNNRMLIIPSRIKHEVLPLSVDGELGRCEGRYCIAQFLFSVANAIAYND